MDDNQNYVAIDKVFKNISGKKNFENRAIRSSDVGRRKNS